MRILVADTSVLIDLERSSLLECAFALQAEFTVPNLLYHRELEPFNGSALQRMGLRVEDLNDEETARAQVTIQTCRTISAPDAFALTLAESRGWCLLSGDGALRSIAESRQIECYGVLWIMDEMLSQEAATKSQLYEGLSALASHDRCRLPMREVKSRLKKYEP